VVEMDESRYRLREFRDSDYAAVAALQKANDPDQPVSVESLRHMFETLLPASSTRNVVVEVRHTGELVGGGVLFQMPFESDSAHLWILGGVHPAHQREGIGSHLYNELASRALQRGATTLRCQVLGSSASGLAFLSKRSFVERRRQWRSRLEVDSANTSQLASLTRSLETDGIELTSLAREGGGDLQVLARVYDLYAQAAKDVPRDGSYTPMPFDQFRQFFFEGDNALPDAWFLARAGDRYVGISQGAREPARPEVLQQNFTGTLPDYRRKKIALALKLMIIDYAQRNGYARIETSNDSLNEPMWMLNQGLGFRKVREIIELETHLAASRSEARPSCT
jgi:mycothiol synthase